MYNNIEIFKFQNFYFKNILMDIFSSKLKTYSIQHWKWNIYRSWKISIIIIFMFMKLIRVNKFVINIKLINIYGEVVCGNLLMSPLHMISCSFFFLSNFVM